MLLNEIFYNGLTQYIFYVVSLVRVIGVDSKRHVISDKKKNLVHKKNKDVIAFLKYPHCIYLQVILFLATVRNNNK